MVYPTINKWLEVGYGGWKIPHFCWCFGCHFCFKKIGNFIPSQLTQSCLRAGATTLSSSLIDIFPSHPAPSTGSFIGIEASVERPPLTETTEAPRKWRCSRPWTTPTSSEPWTWCDVVKKQAEKLSPIVLTTDNIMAALTCFNHIMAR